MTYEESTDKGLWFRAGRNRAMYGDKPRHDLLPEVMESHLAGYRSGLSEMGLMAQDHAEIIKESLG